MCNANYTELHRINSVKQKFVFLIDLMQVVKFWCSLSK